MEINTITGPVERLRCPHTQYVQDAEQMVKLPATVVRNAGMNAANRQIKISSLRRAFFAAGYGMNSANKWIQFYIDQEIIYESGKDTETKEILVSSLWW